MASSSSWSRKRLGQKLDGAPLHGLHCHGNVAVTGDEVDWKMDARFCKLSLEVEPAHSREPDIKHETALDVRLSLCRNYRAEQLDLQPNGAKKALQTIAN